MDIPAVTADESVGLRSNWTFISISIKHIRDGLFQQEKCSHRFGPTLDGGDVEDHIYILYQPRASLVDGPDRFAAPWTPAAPLLRVGDMLRLRFTSDTKRRVRSRSELLLLTLPKICTKETTRIFKKTKTNLRSTKYCVKVWIYCRVTKLTCCDPWFNKRYIYMFFRSELQSEQSTVKRL